MGMKPIMNEPPLPIRNQTTGRKIRANTAGIKNMSVPERDSKEAPVKNSIQKKHGR